MSYIDVLRNLCVLSHINIGHGSPIKFIEDTTWFPYEKTYTRRVFFVINALEHVWDDREEKPTLEMKNKLRKIKNYFKLRLFLQNE